MLLRIQRHLQHQVTFVIQPVLKGVQFYILDASDGYVYHA
jgi:hypothetical protein